MTWIRTRRRPAFSIDLPSSQEPYTGVFDRRPLCRVSRLQDAAQPLRQRLVGLHRGVSLVRLRRCSADSCLVASRSAPKVDRVRLVIAQCTVDYVGRLTAHLPSARRLLLIKADGSVSVHADDRAYKPLNWMSPPCRLTENGDGPLPVWVVENKAGEQLRITLEDVEHDSVHELGVDPGW